MLVVCLRSVQRETIELDRMRSFNVIGLTLEKQDIECMKHTPTVCVHLL